MRVELDNVSKRFGGVVAVDAVQLEIADGEFFFLLGPSGCGKTTLLRLIAGFETPDGGTIRFDGVDVARTPPERRDTGLVFQNYALWPHMTVGENIVFGLETRRLPAAERATRLAEMLALVRLEDCRGRRPAQLSGGQQQRVALARALAIRPRLMLLDEPLSNLDARLRLEMRGELRAIIKRAGHTSIYVTHDQKEALAMADRCAILRDGRIEQVGPPRTLYERPCNRFVAAFLGETNFVPAIVAENAGETASVLLPDGATRWRGVVGGALKPGARAVCSVRPEALHIGPPPDGEANLLCAVLESSMFLGETTQHHARAELGGRLPLRILELHPPPREPGALSLWAHPCDTVILPEEA